MAKQFFPVDDFSGGLTENFIPGQPNQYLAADNLILVPSGAGKAQFKTRPGSQVIDTTNARLPTGDQRVSELINFDYDTMLLAVSGTKVYQYAAGPTWSSILGPTSLDPFPGASEATVHRGATWQHHLFMVADSGDLPIKIYKNESGIFCARTAGLPAITQTANSSDATLLTNLIALAVELRTQMMAHYNHYENAGPDNTKQHLAKHTAAYDALDAWVSPTTLATLITAVNLLTTHYTAHIDDAQLIKQYSASGAAQTYHRDRQYTAYDSATTYGDTNFGQYAILNFDLNPTISIGTTLQTVRLRLNDLRMRWNMHTYATWTHGSTSTYGQHKSTVAEVAYTSGPSIAPNLNFLITYALNIHISYGGHIADALRHTAADSTNTNGGPAGTDKETLIIELAHLQHAYYQHSLDADYSTAKVARTYNRIEISDIVNGSPTVVAATDPALLFSVGFYVTRFSNQIAAPFTWQTAVNPYFVAGTATISSIDSAAPFGITFSANANGNKATATSLICSASKYHSNPNPASAVLYSIGAKNAIHDMDPAFSLTNLCAAYATFKAKYLAHHTATNGWAGSDTTGSLYPPHEYEYVPGNIPVIGNYNADAAILGYTPQTANYNYQLIHLFEYTVGTVDFEDRGPGLASPVAVETVLSPFASASDSAAANYPLYVANIPTLANSTTKNYATGTIKIEVYRTGNALTNYYKVGSVTNGTGTLTDSVIDANLSGGLALYTNGGVVNNDPAPAAKALTIVKNVAYYGNITEADGTTYPNRVRHSIENDPDSCPSEFFDDLDSPVTILASYRNSPVSICEQHLYLLSGGFDTLGRGALTHDLISDKVGSRSPRSAVQTEYGVFFAGLDGFYLTDGYSVTPLTMGNLRATYAALTISANQRARIHGTYDLINKQVLWTVQTTANGSDCDLTFVLDLRFPSKVFTTFSNGTSWAPSCFGYYSNQVYRGDERGYVFKHDSSYTTDPRVDTSTGAVNWVTKAIRFNYLSCAFDFGETAYRKSATVVDFLAKDSGDLSVQINSIDDVGRHFSNLKPIRFRGNSAEQGTNALIVLPPTSGETFTGMIDEWRRFVAGTQRFEHKQIQITNAWVVIENSDTLGLANSDGAANTVTLVNGANSWSANAVDYAIAFETDNYVTEWTVATRTSNTVLTLSDPGGTLTTANNRKWVLRGYPRGEKMHLISYNIHYEILGKSQKDYGGNVSEGGANA